MCSVVVDCWTNSEAGKKKRARLTILSLKHKLLIVSPAAEGAPASSAVEAVTLGVGEGEGGGEERGGGEG